MLKELAHEFARDEVRPHAEHWDETAHYPKETIQAAHEMGLLNLHIPEAYGGAGLGTFEEAIVNEELAWGDPGFATAAYATALASAPIITGATDEQKEHRPKNRRGRRLGYAVAEPGAGSDVAAVKPRPSGTAMNTSSTAQKMWITGAAMPTFFVLAKTPPEAGYRGMSILGGKRRAGFSLGKKETNMGQRCSNTRSITFDDVRVPVDHLIGGSESGGWITP